MSHANDNHSETGMQAMLAYLGSKATGHPDLPEMQIPLLGHPQEEWAMKSCVYAIRNLVNDKRYIGSSSDFDRRKVQHLRLLRMGEHHSPSCRMPGTSMARETSCSSHWKKSSRPTRP